VNFRLLRLALLLLGTAAMATERLSFTVVSKADGVEVRDYPAYVVAETVVTGERAKAGNDAFGRLAGYIFGGNTGSQKIAMTAPVVQTGTTIAMTAPVVQTATAEGSWRVQFTMPTSWTLQTLPTPNDARVVLRAMPARRMVALRYSGTWSDANYAEHLELLVAAMKKQGLVAKGPPEWARYDSPITPWFLRTNEILIEVMG
jgi:SOUL heme-binding protein